MMRSLIPARDYLSADTTPPKERPDFSGVLDRILERLQALGISAPADQVDAAVLDIAQYVARFTLEWVEGDNDEPSRGLE
jgi:hypothetical protein